MKGLATILRETKIPQGKGALATYLEGKLIDKCALGVISCEVGMKVPENRVHQIPLYDYYKILEKAGISQEDQVKLPLHTVHLTNIVGGFTFFFLLNIFISHHTP